MAKFKYIGDPNDNFAGPHITTQYGHVFAKGEVVDVDDKATFKHPKGRMLSVVEQLQGNSHFIDMADKDQTADVAARQKAMEKLEADKAKAAEEQRKKDEADEKQRQDNLVKAQRNQTSGVTSETAPRPPGKVTREPVVEAFGGRTVEERTQTEDHTKAGKTKS